MFPFVLTANTERSVWGAEIYYIRFIYLRKPKLWSINVLQQRSPTRIKNNSSFLYCCHLLSYARIHTQNHCTALSVLSPLRAPVTRKVPLFQIILNRAMSKCWLGSDWYLLVLVNLVIIPWWTFSVKSMKVHYCLLSLDSSRAQHTKWTYFVPKFNIWQKINEVSLRPKRFELYYFIELENTSAFRNNTWSPSETNNLHNNCLIWNYYFVRLFSARFWSVPICQSIDESLPYVNRTLSLTSTSGEFLFRSLRIKQCIAYTAANTKRR